MSKINIYGSSGNLRYPSGAESLSPDEKKAVSDLFFDGVLIEYERGRLRVFFQASTGTPEQFFGEYRSDQISGILKQAHDQLVNVIEQELEWSLADPQVSVGHELFTSIPSSEPIRKLKYDINTIRNATEEHLIDFGVPDHQTALELCYCLIEALEGDRSVAIGKNGRTGSIRDHDIVISPEATDTEIEAINGSHEILRETFTSTKVTETIYYLNRYVNRQQLTAENATNAVVDILTKQVLNVSKHGFVATSPTKESGRNRTRSITAALIAGFASFATAFVVSDGWESLVEWYGELTGDQSEIQLHTLELLQSVGSIPSPEIQSISLVIVTSILLLLWCVPLAMALGVVGVLSSTPTSSRQNQPLGRNQHNQLVAIASDVENSDIITMSDYLTELADRSNDLEASIYLKSKVSRTKSQGVKIIVGIVVGVGIFGVVGYISGTVLGDILQEWQIISESLLLFTLVAGVALFILLITRTLFRR